MQYDVSEKAEADIYQLFVDGVGKYGEARAELYWAGLFQQLESLTRNPELYHERFELMPPVRVCPYGVHVVIYLVQSNSRVLIIRVRHMREDWL